MQTEGKRGISLQITEVYHSILLKDVAKCKSSIHELPRRELYMGAAAGETKPSVIQKWSLSTEGSEQSSAMSLSL